MDHHIIAAVSVSGISLDVLGGLYLAYDLLSGQPSPGRQCSARSAGLLFGAGRMLGFSYATTFAALITVEQIVAHSNGMCPSIDYPAVRRSRLTRRQLWGGVQRAVTERSVGYFFKAAVQFCTSVNGSAPCSSGATTARMRCPSAETSY